MDFTEAKAHKEFRNMDLGPLFAFFQRKDDVYTVGMSIIKFVNRNIT